MDFIKFLNKNPPGKIYARENLYRYAMYRCEHVGDFLSALHDNFHTWADAGPLKVKYLVNAVKYKHNL